MRTSLRLRLGQVVSGGVRRVRKCETVGGSRGAGVWAYLVVEGDHFKLLIWAHLVGPIVLSDFGLEC